MVNRCWIKVGERKRIMRGLAGGLLACGLIPTMVWSSTITATPNRDEGTIVFQWNCTTNAYCHLLGPSVDYSYGPGSVTYTVDIAPGTYTYMLHSYNGGANGVEETDTDTVTVTLLEPIVNPPADPDVGARFEDFIENKIIILFTPDGFPIIFYEVDKYRLDKSYTNIVSCTANGTKCPDGAISSGAVFYKYVINPAGGKAVLYFDSSQTIIGFGLNRDGDLYGDNQDPDIDGDGVQNNADAFAYDPTETVDSDGDGVGDNSDAFPDDPTEWKDSDGDGIGDNAEANNTFKYEYDALGRLVKVQTPHSGKTEYQYDAADNRLRKKTD